MSTASLTPPRRGRASRIAPLLVISVFWCCGGAAPGQHMNSYAAPADVLSEALSSGAPDPAVTMQGSAEPGLPAQDRGGRESRFLPQSPVSPAAYEAGTAVRDPARPGVEVEGGLAPRHFAPLKRSDIRQVQKQLSKLGFRIGRADGVIGDRTRVAVESFRRERGITEPELLGPQTREAIERTYLELVEKSVRPPASAPVVRAGAGRPDSILNAAAAAVSAISASTPADRNDFESANPFFTRGTRASR